MCKTCGSRGYPRESTKIGLLILFLQLLKRDLLIYSGPALRTKPVFAFHVFTAVGANYFISRINCGLFEY